MGEDIFTHIIENKANIPTEQMIRELFQQYSKIEAINRIKQKIRYIRLGRIEKRLCSIRRLTLVNLWRYLLHKTMDIKI